MTYATIRNMNLKESKESERNLALLLQVPLQFPLSGLPYCNPKLSHISDHQHEWLFSITAVWSGNTLQRNSKHQTPTINKETPNLLQQVNQRPHQNMALATDKNGQGIGLPWQSPAEYAARRGLYLQAEPLRSWWVTLPAQALYTQQGPCISPLETGLQGYKMNSIFQSGISHLVWLGLCKITWNIWTFQDCIFSWQILKISRNAVHFVNALLLMLKEW